MQHCTASAFCPVMTCCLTFLFNDRECQPHQVATAGLASSPSDCSHQIDMDDIPEVWFEDIDALVQVKEHASMAHPQVKQAKILRDPERVDPTDGLPRSRGLGFVEFTEHEHAICALRQLNNNPAPFGEPIHRLPQALAFHSCVTHQKNHFPWHRPSSANIQSGVRACRPCRQCSCLTVVMHCGLLHIGVKQSNGELCKLV